MKSIVLFCLLGLVIQSAFSAPSKTPVDNKLVYSTCFSGREQSPIDIAVKSTKENSKKMKMEYYLNDQKLQGLKLHDSKDDILIHGNFSKLKATDVLGHTYSFEAQQLHFHAPAEHSIDGKIYDLELHIVHAMTNASAAKARTQRKLAVVGFFFQVDKSPNATHNAFIDALNLNKDDGSTFDMNVYQLFNKDLSSQSNFFSYRGSLTYPPCSETVNWYLFEQPLKITQDQLDHFNLRWKSNFDFAEGKGNNRAPQALNTRVVQASKNFKIFPVSAYGKSATAATPKPAVPVATPKPVVTPKPVTPAVAAKPIVAAKPVVAAQPPVVQKTAVAAVKK